MIRLLLSNHILITGIAAWGISQFLKIIIYTIINREFVLERLFGDGGMPSSHSATVTSVAIASGRVCGWDSPVFAVAVIVAIIVMHDARPYPSSGCRRLSPWSDRGHGSRAIDSIRL